MEGERGEEIIFYLYDLNKPPECYEKNTQGTIPSYSVDKKQNKTKQNWKILNHLEEVPE